MARYYDEEGYEQPRPRRQSGFNIQFFMIGLLCTVILLGIGLLRFRPDLILPSASNTQPAPASNIGGQAPPVVRGTNSAPRVVATPIPGIALDEEESQAQYDAAVRAGEQAAQPAINAPLPLNSAGEPVIDTIQQQQLNFSAEMAAQEAQASYDNARAADVASRPPDVSYEDAKALLGRDPCSVPRANPHTCGLGLWKNPTPVK